MAGWLDGWLVRLHWNAGSFVCLREEWVRERMPLMIAEKKNEPPGSVLSLSRLPRSHSLCLSFPIFFFLCVRTFTVPSLSLLRPQSPGTTTALSCPVNTHTHTPPLLGAYVCQGQGNTGPLLLFLSTSLLLLGWSVCVGISA